MRSRLLHAKSSLNKLMNRRSFLKRTALTAGAVSAGQYLAGPNLLAADAGKKLNCGLIGCGGRAMNHLECFIDRAGQAGTIDLGIDQTALVQEFVPARGGHITRIETLGGRYLYGIRVFTSGESFNLCPADICQTTDGVELTRLACPIDAPKSGLQVEGYTPPAEVIDAVERIVAAAQIDVGGVEYIIDDRDGSLLYYDINALSNFVADAPRVIGFDPHARLVDFLETEANKCATVTGYQFSAVG